MSYYTDLDEWIGQSEEAERDFREYEREQRERASIERRKIKNEVQRQLKKLGVSIEKKPQRGAKVEVSCACCKKKFMARVADRNRGWGRFCSKRCKARMQNNNLR